MELVATTDGQVVSVKKTPRKPRPSEIAAKEAKAAAKRKPKGKTHPRRKARNQPKRKRPASSKARVRKAAKKVLKARAAARKSVTSKAVRTERLDMRVTKADKRKLETVAKRRGIPVTYVVLKAIAGLR